MNKTIVGVGMAFAATALVAADATLTPEQQAAKCLAEGGCISVTRDGLIAALQVASELAYKTGLRACNSNI